MGMGDSLTTAKKSPCFHLPGFHFGVTLCLTHTQMTGSEYSSDSALAVYLGIRGSQGSLLFRGAAPNRTSKSASLPM